MFLIQGLLVLKPNPIKSKYFGLFFPALFWGNLENNLSFNSCTFQAKAPLHLKMGSELLHIIGNSQGYGVGISG